ncbi:MAG: bacterioferritin [Acidimicrobiia bacterium]
MQGDPKVIEILNRALALELTAINQYLVNSKLLENIGATKLAKMARDESFGEMRHAELLIDRIVYLEGKPEMSYSASIVTWSTLGEMLGQQLDLERDAVKLYNDGISVALASNDAGSRMLMEKILQDEEEEVEWYEAQLELLERIGEAAYLQLQAESAEEDDE